MSTERTSTEQAPEAARRPDARAPDPLGEVRAGLAAEGLSAPERRRLLALQRAAGNATVRRLLREVAPPASSAAAHAEATATIAGLAPDAFLDRVRDTACEVAARELRGTPFDVATCPWIGYWLERYRGRGAAELRQVLAEYAPQAADEPDPERALALVGARISAGIAAWRAGGDIPAMPADPAAGAAVQAADGARRVLARTPASPDLVRQRLGAGRPLDPGTQDRMQRAFSHDLSQVRVHDDARGAELSRGLGARAVAVGHHVAFAPGAYRPGTPLGDALIAHELAHVVQQGEPVGLQAGTGELERDADLAAFAALSGAAAAPRLRSGLRLQACLEPPDRDADLLPPEEAHDAIEEYDLRLAPNRTAPRVPVGFVATFEVSSNYGHDVMGGDGMIRRAELIGYPWFVFRPGEVTTRERRPEGMRRLTVTFDAPGDWTIRAQVRLPDRSVVELDYVMHVEPLADVAGAAFDRTRTASQVTMDAALELQAVEASGGVVRDQRIGPGDWISLTSGANPVRPAAPMRARYTINEDPGAPASAQRATSFRWLAVPDSASGFPAGYGGHSTTRYLGRFAFDLGGGREASLHLERPGRYQIICEELDRESNVLRTIRYWQVVMTADQAQRADRLRDVRRRADATLARIVRGTETGLRAIHTSAASGHSTELTLFVGPAAEGSGYVLVDLTPGVERSEYGGATVAAAVQDFEDANTYPGGLIVVEGSGVPRRQIVTNGTSDVREVSSGFGWASLGLGVLGVVALFTPAAVAAPYLFAASAASGVVSGATSLADELRNNEPSAIRIGIDVVGIAGSIIGLGQAGRAISAGARTVTMSSGARFLIYSGFTTDVVQGVLITVESAGQIDRILSDRSLSESDKTDQIVRILAMLAFTGGMLAYGARDLRGAHTRVGGAIGDDAITRSLRAESLHHLDALEGTAMTALRGRSAEELERIAALAGTNREAARRLSREYGEQFVERAASGRFRTLEDLADDLGAAAARRPAADPGGAAAGTGERRGGAEPEPESRRTPHRTEQGDVDALGRPDDAMALTHHMSEPNAHGEPHVFHMTERGQIFRCSDVCADLVANIEARTRAVRETSARAQRSLPAGRNWREEAAEITASARRLRAAAERAAAAHQRRVATISGARTPDRAARLEASRRQFLDDARESLMTRAEALEQRMSRLEAAIGLQPRPDVTPAGPPASSATLRTRYGDVLGADEELRREMEAVERAQADPAQAVDARRRLQELERRLRESVEAGLPSQIARARQLQVQAGDDLVRVTVNGRPAEKCRAAAGDIQTVSGANTVAGYEQRTEAVIRRGGEIGHTFAPDNFDEAVGAVINRGRPAAERIPVTGTARASHAEKQAALARPGEPIGVSLPMCFDCYEFFRRLANATGRPHVVADPDMVRVFYPDGRVLSPSRSGVSPLGGAQP